MELQLLSCEEFEMRLAKLQSLMKQAGMDAILITDNANTYYLTGRVFSGYIYIPLHGNPLFFVKRPNNLKGNNTIHIRKPEMMTETIGDEMPSTIGLELDVTSWSDVERLKKIFAASTVANASPIMRKARSVKTSAEIEKIKESGLKHEHVYRMIPKFFRQGMTDVELQVEIERASRLEGCLGQFRISGDSMELYMGNILTGDNADTPTPYDFAMGGEGMDPSLPVGCNGTIIHTGKTVMVDVNGNYTGYMTDMTRTFKVGEINPLAKQAHQCSIDICHRLQKESKPGTEAKVMYEIAEQMANEYGLHDYFMGHKQKAGFIGHGVGIEINESPVVAPRSRDLLEEGNIIALEPKFVIPGVGAVGIENTYLVTATGLECLTNAPEQIIDLI